MDFPTMLFILELLGTIAFASSGAMLGIQRKLDIFGVNVLGVTTAVGGGLIRDVILGITPPAMFCDSRYTLLAMFFSTGLFLVVWFRRSFFTGEVLVWYNRIMNICDMIGLGLFTVIGMNTAVQAGFGNRHFLMAFVGVLTGVGGGLLRDMMAGVTPYILVKHVYAVASIAGAIITLLLRPYLPWMVCMIIGAVTVIVIRFLASRYQWNLPRIE